MIELFSPARLALRFFLKSTLMQHPNKYFVIAPGETNQSNFQRGDLGKCHFYLEGGLWKFFKFWKFLVTPLLYE